MNQTAVLVTSIPQPANQFINLITISQKWCWETTVLMRFLPQNISFACVLLQGERMRPDAYDEWARTADNILTKVPGYWQNNFCVCKWKNIIIIQLWPLPSKDSRRNYWIDLARDLAATKGHEVYKCNSSKDVLRVRWLPYRLVSPGVCGFC